MIFTDISRRTYIAALLCANDLIAGYIVMKLRCKFIALICMLGIAPTIAALVCYNAVDQQKDAQAKAAHGLQGALTLAHLMQPVQTSKSLPRNFSSLERALARSGA